MTEREQAARAIGYLEGLSVTIWALTDEKMACEYADAYDRAVEVLRKAIFDNKVDE